MRFVSVRDLRTKGRQVWEDLAKEKELVVTSNGKPFTLITGVSEANLEEAIADLRRARALRAIEEKQRAALDAGLDKMIGR
jgi:antitoxin (DNA-binding transcriptional repressor) of toxin-antitoxin stability system